jgi:hypothetical protein
VKPRTFSPRPVRVVPEAPRIASSLLMDEMSSPLAEKMAKEINVAIRAYGDQRAAEGRQKALADIQSIIVWDGKTSTAEMLRRIAALAAKEKP